MQSGLVFPKKNPANLAGLEVLCAGLGQKEGTLKGKVQFLDHL